MANNTLTFNVTAHARENGMHDYNKLREILTDNGYSVDGEHLENGETIMIVDGIDYNDFLDFADEADIENVNDFISGGEDDMDLESELECDGANCEMDECDDFVDECDGEDCDLDECDELTEDSFIDFDDEGYFDDGEPFIEDDDAVLNDVPAYDKFSDEEIKDMSDDYYSCLDDEALVYESKRNNVGTRAIRENLNRTSRDRIRRKIAAKKRINEKLELYRNRKVRRNLNEKAEIIECLKKRARRRKMMKKLKETRMQRHHNNAKSLNERRMLINEKYAINKKKGCCGGNGNGKLYNLLEALKAFDPKQQKKLDKSVKTVEDLVKDLKGQTIGQTEVVSAFKKLKAEQNKMKKIAKNDKDYYKVIDVPGVTALIKKMIEADPEHAEEIKKFRKSLIESIVNALNARKKSLYENVKIDGVKVKNIKARKLFSILKEAKSFKAKYTAKLKSTFEDSELSEKLKNAINNKNKLIALINEELSYRYICNTVAKKLFEGDDSEDKDTDTEDSGSSDISDKDLAKMFGTADDTSDEDTESDEKDSEDEEVELARVVIDMATKEDAEEMKQYCIDAGIPEDAIEIEEGSEDEESDDENSDKESEDNEEGSEDEESDDKNSDDSANESIAYKELRRLFEDEESDDENSDKESEDNEEDAESEEESVKFILTDTDYVDELAEVLNDVYGITKEEFEEMIGGEIVNEDDKDDDEDTDEDSADSDEKKEDDVAEDSDEEEISASEIFVNK